VESNVTVVLLLLAVSTFLNRIIEFDAILSAPGLQTRGNGINMARNYSWVYKI
jgi:hypothetical protein